LLPLHGRVLALLPLLTSHHFAHKENKRTFYEKSWNKGRKKERDTFIALTYVRHISITMLVILDEI